MISHRHIKVIAVLLLLLVTIGCLAAMHFSEPLTQQFGKASYEMEYETALFDTDTILDIAIAIDETDWQAMLQNATDEVYYQCDVSINGTTFYRVGIRPKGNTSLSFVAKDADNDRYSFKLEFDQFVDGQTCYGLDKLVLNNNYADKTNMKEAIVYDMYQTLDADASLYNYAKISVNGEYWGGYLALEAVEDSFLFRNYGTGEGKLYKPEGMMHSGGGANLNYIDDNLESYSTIWEGTVVDSDDADHRRVVTALQQIYAGTNLDQYLDIDNVLSYMAVHNFAVNEDSLSGSMAHNYYLYEQDGRLNMIPWDYNLAFGGMHNSSGTALINEPIDDGYQSTKFFDALLTDYRYLNQYHNRYAELIELYFDSGKFEATYQRIRAQIDALVEADPNAMYSYEEYLSAVEVLHDTVQLRAESVKGQLSGTIPSTSAEQRQDSTALVDGSHINVNEMGAMMGGGGMKMPGGQRVNADNADANAVGNQPMQMPTPPEGVAIPENMTSPENAGFPEGTPNFGQNNDTNNTQDNRPTGNGMNRRPSENRNDMPQMGEQSSAQQQNYTEQMISLALCIGLLAPAFVFVKLYKRKNF